MTYKITIHSDYGSLSAYKKYHKNDSWTIIQEKTQNDFFNDIEAVRYDYTARQAFVSLTFSPTSDSLFLKICNNSNDNVPIQFSEISKYYDNRDAAVTTTADDLYKNTLNEFNKAISLFRSRKLWLSGAVITDSSWAMDSSAWKVIQKQLDSGYVEVVSHSRNHLHPPYNYQSEVRGSKEDIIKNLDLPSLSTRNDIEYIYAYVHPFGEYNDEIDYVAGNVNYLVTRGVYAYHYNFTQWNPLKKIYERMDVACELGPLWGGITDLPTLNSMFDGVVQNKTIYHFYIHPQVIENSNVWNILIQHLNYISGKKNIWYIAFGYLILYHFIQESTILFDPPKIISTPITSVYLGKTYIDTLCIDGYPEPKYYLNNGPTGMIVDSITGIITWTPDSSGLFAVELKAANNWGSDTLRYNIKVVGNLLSVQLILEGMYDSASAQMKTSLNSIIPTTSPYTEDPRSVDSIPPDIVDWVLLELRADGISPPNYAKTILLDKSGSLVSDNGVNHFIVLDSIFGSYYVVVKHRNSLETWSASRVSLNSEKTVYNFTNDSSRAYGLNMIRKGHHWCIYSGDLNMDGYIDTTDLFLINNYGFDFASGYLSGDLTGDGFVDLNDLVICDNNVYNLVEVKKPMVELLKKSGNQTNDLDKVNK